MVSPRMTAPIATIVSTRPEAATVRLVNESVPADRLDDAVEDFPVTVVSLGDGPTGEIGPVEKRLESLGGRIWGGICDGGEGEEKSGYKSAGIHAWQSIRRNGLGTNYFSDAISSSRPWRDRAMAHESQTR